jgi:hypothetical protein
MTRARVWSPSGDVPPGTLTDVTLPVTRIGTTGVELPGVTVSYVGAGRLVVDDDLRFGPRDGGGPLCSPEHRREARACGVVNVAFHLQRGLDRIAALLGRPLPRLAARIGVHALAVAVLVRWPLPPAGAHLFDAHRGGATRADGGDPSGIGEGFRAAREKALLPCAGAQRRHRLPRARPPPDPAQRRPACQLQAPRGAQANRKVALDEGTSDYLAAILLETPDIYGWHRHHVPSSSPERRRLDGSWTMAAYDGGGTHDPHCDGAIWASALWAARSRLERCGVAPVESTGWSCGPWFASAGRRLASPARRC